MGRIIRRTRRRHHHPQGQLNRRWDTLSGATSEPQKQQVRRSRRDRLEAENLSILTSVPGIDLDRLRFCWSSSSLRSPCYCPSLPTMGSRPPSTMPSLPLPAR